MSLPKKIDQREYDKFRAGGSGWSTVVISNDSDGLTKAIDYNSGTNPIYIGEAAAGSATSSVVWRIKKITYDGNNNPTNIQWAGGVADFNQIYDNRASLSYS